MRYILGIDGGNSKTLVMLADEAGNVLGAGRAGCGSHQAVGPQAALVSVRDAAEEAALAASVRLEDVTTAFYALAGADLDVDYRILRESIGPVSLAPQWALDNDVIAALRAGTDKADAVVVALGSGTNAAGRNSRGREIRMAGIGWMSGDWGGAGDLTREAVRRAVRAWDGRGSETMLERAIPAALSLPSIQEVIEALHTRQFSRNALFGLAPVIFEAAEAGDAVAAELIAEQGREVAATAIALLRRLDLLDSEADVVLGGSLFRTESQLLLGTINDRVMGIAPDVVLVIPAVEPAVGAVICGMELAGFNVDLAMRERLAATSVAAMARLRPLA